MAPSLREDPLLPHDYLRIRVHGPILVAQPYKGKYCSGVCLLIDLLRGACHIALHAANMHQARESMPLAPYWDTYVLFAAGNARFHCCLRRRDGMYCVGLISPSRGDHALRGTS